MALSLGQFAQRTLARGHDLARRRHLLLEIRLPAYEFDPVGLEYQRQLVTHLPVEMRQHLLGQDNPGGIADPGDFERLVHTSVITAGRLFSNSFADRIAVSEGHLPDGDDVIALCSAFGPIGMEDGFGTSTPKKTIIGLK